MAKNKDKEIDEYLQEAHDEATGVVGATKKADKVDEELMKAHNEATGYRKGGCVKMAKRWNGICAG